MNAERFDQAMDLMGVRGVLATTYENVVYAGDFSSVTGRMYPQLPHWCLVPHSTQGQPILIMPIVEAGLLADLGRDAGRVCLFGRMTEHVTTAAALDAPDAALLAMSASAPRLAVEAVARACEIAGLSNARIAVDCSQGNAALTLLGASGGSIQWTPDGESALLWARMVKTPAEIERIRAAGRLNQAAITAGIDALGQGGSDLDFAQAWRAQVVAAGGEPTFMMAGSGKRAGTFRPPTGHTARTGDRFRWDSGLRLDGYCADTGGTVQIRAEPGADELRTFNALTGGVRHALEWARPGMRVSELYQRVMSEVHTRGVAQFAHPHVGHGIGVEARDIPVLTSRQGERPVFIQGEFDPLIEVGMVLNVETPLSLLGEGGYQQEVTMHIGEAGNELLTPLHPYYIAGQ